MVAPIITLPTQALAFIIARPRIIIFLITRDIMFIAILILVVMTIIMTIITEAFMAGIMDLIGGIMDILIIDRTRIGGRN